MTVTVAADVTLAELQAALGKARQWLPLDPPNPNLTIRELLDRNEGGPRRFGYGTVRDYVIGLKVRLADGRIVKSGGQVVKNVAGYDLQKLFIGSGGTLGTPLEVTFKLRPLPEREQFVQRTWAGPALPFHTLQSVEVRSLPHFAKCGSAGETVEAVLASELMPVVFDLHSLPERGLQPASTSASETTLKRPEGRTPITIVLGFDGTQEDVDWQLALAAKLGFQEPASLDYDRSFRADATSLRKLSVLPSKLTEALAALGDEPFVARAGNGIIYHRANVPAPQPALPANLVRRVKDAFDPKHIFPELPS